MMGCRLGTFPFTYLGLPLSHKPLNKQAYLPLLQKFQRLLGWAEKVLSIAGRLVLLNDVLSSLPIYFMLVFLLPKGVIQEIDRARRHFLWHGVTPITRKLNLANWQMICKPKIMGGLGIMDLGMFNQALLMKWLWQWMKLKRRLWKSIFKITNGLQHFYPNAYFFNKILKVVEPMFNISVVRIPGEGRNILLWIDNWGLGRLS